MSGIAYLDHAASAPVRPEVAEAMAQCLRDPALQANPSASHAAGQRAAAVIEQARARVAALIAAAPGEIVFTSGATESINLAILGAARAPAATGRRLLTSRIEHRAVLEASRQLEREGHAVDYLAPTAAGRIEAGQVAAALRPDTLLAAFQLASNELGTVQDIAAIAAACRTNGTLLHVDAAQAVGRVPVAVAALGADFLSLSGHKLGGPKGVGALWVAGHSRHRLSPALHGGGQEGGLRAGTLATHQVLGLGLACELAARSLASEGTRLSALRERLWERLQPAAPLLRHAAGVDTLPGLLSVRFPGIEGESLLLALDGAVAASSGSACNSASGEPSYVLRSIGLDDLAAQCTLRLSLGWSSSAKEIERAADAIVAAVDRLRRAAPRAAVAEIGA